MRQQESLKVKLSHTDDIQFKRLTPFTLTIQTTFNLNV